MKKDLISVIVPMYNIEKYLPRCIESILNQTYKKIEIILVDDGSKDLCGSIADNYASRYENVKVIHKANGGLSDARNAGIEIANGEWLAFVDSDDMICENMYQVLHDEVIKNNALLAMVDYFSIDENDEIILTSEKGIENTRVLTTEMFLDYLYTYQAGHYIIAWNKLYYYTLFKDIKFPVGKINEDQFIMHEIVYKAKNIACLTEKLYQYRKVDNSIMNRKFNINRLDDVEGVQKRFDFLLKQNFNSYLVKTESLAFNKLKKGIQKLDLNTDNFIRCKSLMDKQKICYLLIRNSSGYSLKKRAERFLAFNFLKIYWKLLKGRWNFGFT